MTDPGFIAKWDQRYAEARQLPDPVRVLSDNLHLLPAAGTALDLGCGLGANALLLAGRGLETRAWDISPVAIERLREFAGNRGLVVHGEVRDVEARPPVPESFDVIVAAHFLERGLAPALMAALRPGGVLFYETWTRTRVDDTGPASEAFRLADNELLELFRPLRLLAYREEGRVGDLSRGFRNKAQLVALRPPE